MCTQSLRRLIKHSFVSPDSHGSMFSRFLSPPSDLSRAAILSHASCHTHPSKRATTSALLTLRRYGRQQQVILESSDLRFSPLFFFSRPFYFRIRNICRKNVVYNDINIVMYFAFYCTRGVAPAGASAVDSRPPSWKGG